MVSSSNGIITHLPQLLLLLSGKIIEIIIYQIHLWKS